PWHIHGSPESKAIPDRLNDSVKCRNSSPVSTARPPLPIFPFMVYLCAGKPLNDGKVIYHFNFELSCLFLRIRSGTLKNDKRIWQNIHFSKPDMQTKIQVIPGKCR